MRICLIGKYPPIEGGVSAQTYWMARGLASRGHSVHVVTNADEVEAEYRMLLEDDDWSWYEPSFPDVGGSVTVYTPEAFSLRAMSHIPASNPFVTKIASVATDVIRRAECDIVVAYYYEPYGIAAWMASRWTGRPLVVKHAGSDLDRLCSVPDLATAYKEVLRNADAVVTQPRLSLRFVGMGVAPGSIEADVPYGLAPDVFTPVGATLDVTRLAAVGGGSVPGAPFDPAIPTIGTLGKIGRSKGTFDLIASLGRLAGEGHRFQLVAMVGEAQGEKLRPSLREAGLEERSWILPLLPNWKVPSFIRSCTAVVFLERDFPIAIHGPVVPREIMACGRCLVLSGEIANKQRYRDQLAPGHNVLVVGDPKDHDELSAALRFVVTNPDRARTIGDAGRQLSREIEQPAAFVDGWERLIARWTSTRPADATGVKGHDGLRALAAVEATVPGLIAFLRNRQPRLVDSYSAPLNGHGPLEATLEFCGHVAATIDRELFGDQADSIVEAIRYLTARLIAVHEPRGDHTALFPASDCLHGGAVSLETVGLLRPVRGNFVRIEDFDYDVSGVFLPSALSVPRDGGDELAAVAPGPITVLFHRSPNLAMRELRIDAATRELVSRCDGSSTTTEIVDGMCRDFQVTTPDEREEASRRILNALERLYASRIIVFGNQQRGRGWTGGPR